MNYLEFFKQRIDVESFKEKVVKFEIEENIKLPPIFKVFSSNYDISFRMEDIISFFDYRFNRKRSMLQGYYEPDRENVIFNEFFNIEEIIPNMKAVYSFENEIWQQEFIAFGECAFQSYLLVGIGEHNMDKIYLESATERIKLRLLCDNIFEFFRNYIIEIDESCLPESSNKSQLFKNWGEDFWRVREEKKE